MKKFLAAAAGMFVMCAAAAASAMEAQYTDIGAYINNYPISAYAVNGKMAVVAEDLKDYGFNVVWNGDARRLDISRNSGVSGLQRRDVYKHTAATGTRFSDIYQTDIKVYYDGIQLESYALNGYTLVLLNDVAELAGNGEWDEGARAFKVWLDGMPSCEFAPLKERCRNLYYCADYIVDMPDFSFNEDMDGDGTNETVSFSTKDIGMYDGIQVALKINDAYINATKDMYCVWNVLAVYEMDIVPNDNAKEIAVFFMTESDDPMLRIYRYSGGNISILNFSTWSDWNGTSINDYLYTGYVSAYPFDLHDDGSFTLQTQTYSRGMWDVYTTYRIDEYGNIVLIPQSEYVVAEGTEYCQNQWGYAYVKKSISGRGFNLYAGDYIKIIRDDGKNHILIQKSTGEKGWFTMYGYSDYDLGEVSALFMMAG
ncbi:MAG: hypothetical protein ACI4TH_09685 [Candidatus Ornithomonoglobus sp.]